MAFANNIWTETNKEKLRGIDKEFYNYSNVNPQIQIKVVYIISN